MARATSLSSVRLKSWPQNCGKLGKHIEPRMPLASMSAMRWSRSQQPGRISANEVGSMPYSSGGLPATALSPMLGSSWPS